MSNTEYELIPYLSGLIIGNGLAIQIGSSFISKQYKIAERRMGWYQRYRIECNIPHCVITGVLVSQRQRWSDACKICRRSENSKRNSRNLDIYGKNNVPWSKRQMKSSFNWLSVTLLEYLRAMDTFNTVVLKMSLSVIHFLQMCLQCVHLTHLFACECFWT